MAAVEEKGEEEPQEEEVDELKDRLEQKQLRQQKHQGVELHLLLLLRRLLPGDLPYRVQDVRRQPPPHGDGDGYAALVALALRLALFFLHPLRMELEEKGSV